MAAEHELQHLDGVGLAGQIRGGTISPRALYDLTIQRMDAVNPKINAVVGVFDEVAEDCLAEREKDAEVSPSPLSDLPVFLKALMSACKGAPLTAASKATEGLVAPFDSAVTARLKRAGLIVAGMTNSPELGLNTSTESQFFGPARNPWDLSLSTGGSSGGAAAAVAAGIVPLSHATDGGGSIRIPAACCGLVGLKPSRGRVSAGPAAGETNSGMSYINSVSRSVRDSAAYLDIIAGPEPGDPYTAPPPARPYLQEVGAGCEPLKIGLCLTSFNGTVVHEECIAAARQTAQLCADLGHEVSEITPVHDVEAFWPTVEPMFAANVALAIAGIGTLRGRPVAADEIEVNTRQMLEIASTMSAQDYLTRLAAMHRLSRQVATLFTEVDVILTPTMAVPEIPLGWLDTMSEDRAAFTEAITPTIAFTALFNVTGMPAITLPVVWRDNGLPIGSQFAAPYAGEDILFRLSAQLEAAQPWARRRPAVFAA